MDSPAVRSLLDDRSALARPHAEEGSAAETRLPGAGRMLNRIAHHLCSDEDLVVRLSRGETEALTVLFDRHSGLVFRIARRIVRDDAEAEDAVQQVFLDLFRSVAKFDPARGSFKVWLLMYAYHRALNHRRGLRAARFYELEDIEAVLRSAPGVETRGPSPFQAAEAAHLVGELLGRIQPRQRRVIELVYYEGCTAEEIAALTGDSPAVVRHSLYRGMDKICSLVKNGAGSTKRSGNKKKIRP